MINKILFSMFYTINLENHSLALKHTDSLRELEVEKVQGFD